MIPKESGDFLQIHDVEKSYSIPNINPLNPSKKTRALNGVNLNIPKGRVTCILGPNGAGKTTLIKILAGLILPDSGEIQWNTFTQTVGLVTPNDRSFYWRLTGRQNLEFFAALYNIKHKSTRVREVLDEVKLQSEADKPYRQYSAGMKQKLNIGRALLSKPSLYLLDEPATHLDPIAKENFWIFIDRLLLQKEGATIILCTHDLEEAKILADHIALLHKGKILAQGEPDFLKQLVQNESYYLMRFASLPSDWRMEFQHLFTYEEENSIILKLKENRLSSTLKSFLEYGGIIKEVLKKEPLLMDIFKHYIGDEND